MYHVLNTNRSLIATYPESVNLEDEIWLAHFSLIIAIYHVHFSEIST